MRQTPWKRPCARSSSRPPPSLESVRQGSRPRRSAAAAGVGAARCSSEPRTPHFFATDALLLKPDGLACGFIASRLSLKRLTSFR